MRRVHLRIMVPVLAALAIAGCDREVILPGERLDIRAPLDAPLAAIPETPVALPRGLSLPAPDGSPNWTQLGGGITHSSGHRALGPAPRLAWSADIGQGSDRRHRITAAPVVAGGRIYTLDSRSTVTATTTAGERLWQVDLTAPGEKSDEVSGGGLAVDGNRLYVTTGFGELVALDTANGARVWKQGLQAASAGPPLVIGGAVYVVSGAAVGWAVDAGTGRVLWVQPGIPMPASIIGGAAPATDGSGTVILPYPNGELRGVAAVSGQPVWQGFVAGQREDVVIASVRGITGDPVISGGRVYAATHSGRAAAVSAADGTLIWTADDGAITTPVVAGGSVFMLTDRNELVRLDAATGQRIWGMELPLWTKKKPKKHKGLYAHYGPVLAGGRLIVVSDDKLMRVVDPATGTPLGQVPLPAAAAADPVVAGGVLYVVTENGRLNAFR